VHNRKCAFDEFYSNPESLWGKTEEEVGNALGKGWTRGTYGTKGTGWKFHKGDYMIGYHPGGGRHGASYYKISSGLGKIKVVGQGYKPGIGEKAKIIYMFGG